MNMDLVFFILIGLIIASALWTNDEMGFGGKLAAIGVLLGFAHTAAPKLVGLLFEGFGAGLASQSWLLQAIMIIVLLYAALMVAGLWRPSKKR